MCVCVAKATTRPNAPKDSEEAKAQWKECMQDLMQDASLKPFGKQLGPFAAFKRDEAAALGVGCLDATVPFDELALLRESVEYLKDKLGMDVDIVLAEQPKEGKEHQEAASQAFCRVRAGVGHLVDHSLRNKQLVPGLLVRAPCS